MGFSVPVLSWGHFSGYEIKAHRQSASVGRQADVN
jgi:hypothetical protein